MPTRPATSSDRAVPLEALSDGQRRRVEAHAGLVHHALRAFVRRGGPCRVGREHPDLVQEGFVALVEAVRSHDPARHGAFAAFAVARIHFAVSQFLHEQSSPVRIPYITQRRRRRRARADAEIDTYVSMRRRPDGGLRDLSASESLRGARHRTRASRSDPAPPVGAGDDRPSLGELLRRRYDRAVRRVSGVLARAATRGGANGELIARCREERWTVPDEGSRTPIRRLARELKCSPGRVTHCEARFRRSMAEALEADRVFVELVRVSRQVRQGWAYRPSDEEMRRLESRDEDARAGDLNGSAD